MNIIWLLALVTYKEGLRHRVLFGVLFVAIVLIFLSMLISSLFLRDLLKVLLDLCLSATSIVGLLIPFFIAVNLLSGDIEKHTIYTILARPISRAQYILGRFLGLSLISASAILILTCSTLLSVYLSTLIYPAHNFLSLSISAIILASVMILTGNMVLISAVFLWCSTTTSSFLTFLLTLSTYIIGHTVEDIVHFFDVQSAAVPISASLKAFLHILLYVFPNLAAFDLKQLAAHGNLPSLSEVALLTGYAGSYIMVMLILAIRFFSKRELS